MGSLYGPKMKWQGIWIRERLEKGEIKRRQREAGDRPEAIPGHLTSYFLSLAQSKLTFGGFSPRRFAGMNRFQKPSNSANISLCFA